MENKIKKIKKIKSFNNKDEFDDLLFKLVKENCEVEDNYINENPFIGYTTDIINIYETSTDKESVEKMFFQFTGVDFEQFLDLCIN